MSKEFRDFVFDILDRTQPFKDDISHLIMKKDDIGDVVAVVRSAGRILSLKATCKQEMPGFDNVACFGSLPYLHSLLKSKYMGSDNAKYDVNFNFQTASDGKTTALRNMRIKAGRMESFYQASDPFINNINRIQTPKIKDWVVGFAIDQGTMGEFDEVSKIHAMAPKIGGERDDIFSMGFDGTSIVASFGEKGHQSSVVLTDDVETLEEDRKVNALFSIRHFKGVLKMIGKGTAVMALSPMGLRIETESEVARYTAVITAKKLVD